MRLESKDKRRLTGCYNRQNKVYNTNALETRYVSHIPTYLTEFLSLKLDSGINFLVSFNLHKQRRKV